MISSNKVKSNHWRTTKKQIDALKLIYTSMIRESPLPKLRYVELDCEFWSRHDADALFYMGKYFIDTLVTLKILPNDTKKYFGRVQYKTNRKLKTNTLVLKLKYEEN